MVDLDGVVADFAGGFRARAEVADGRSYSEPVSWLFPVQDWGWTKARWNDTFAEWSADGLYGSLSPLPGAVGAIRRLFDADFVVHFLTARPADTTVETVIWLSEHFGGEAWRWTLETSGDKIGGDRFVAAFDDYIPNLDQLAASGCPRSVVVDHPWNRSDDGGHRRCVDLASGVDELLAELCATTRSQ